MTEPTVELDQLISRLDDAASQLRSGELDADAAAAMVDECARVAAQAAAELDRQARATEPPPGQESLL
jgi:hypothetical protein